MFIFTCADGIHSYVHIWPVLPSHSTTLLQDVFLGFLDPLLWVLPGYGSLWKWIYFYLRILRARIFWIHIFPTHVCGSRTRQSGAIHDFFGCFGSLVMGPSWIWIFMKMNIFIFEVLKNQDFLDPDFSDTRIWVRKMSEIMDTPTLKGPGPTYICWINVDP